MALSLEKVTATAPGLVSLYKSARVSLAKVGLQDTRAAVYLVLDRSGSMRPYYRSGTVQHFAEQVLALSAHLDDDGRVPVVFFSTEVDGVAEISLDDHRDRIGRLHSSYGPMGRTNYHLAMKAVIRHYQLSGSTEPALVVFQTDGGPSSRPAARDLLCLAAELPVYWQFVGFGDPDVQEFAFLHRLDELPVPARRPVDNAGFFAAGRDPRSVGDAELYDRLLTGFPEWLAAAGAAGILDGR
ncbi:VWA domain-containing protein [Streptomyces sp. TLI_171]|uniref:VWA domain-containing protein n=1 Tax=Streptomyces sp. TLI_171 TaxID=1938859 RepID=UPI000C199F5A|nr:VWA domain-containing protein [Streptomyces sp. TLI_171]RKE19578.1 TerF-like vWA domain-containing protein [Streptomyces sp. TLI_171]